MKSNNLPNEVTSKQGISNRVIENAVKEISALKNFFESDVIDKPIKNNQATEVIELFNAQSTGKGLKNIK